MIIFSYIWSYFNYGETPDVTDALRRELNNSSLSEYHQRPRAQLLWSSVSQSKREGIQCMFPEIPFSSAVSARSAFAGWQLMMNGYMLTASVRVIGDGNIKVTNIKSMQRKSSWGLQPHQKPQICYFLPNSK